MALTDADGNVLTRSALDALTEDAPSPGKVLTDDVYETAEYAGAEDPVTLTDAHGDGVSRGAVLLLKWPAGTLLTTAQLDDAYPVPTVTSVAPATGPAAGGTTVKVNGTGFARGQHAIGMISAKGHVTGVTFGGNAATAVKVLSDTQLECVTPAHAAGAVTVAVTSAAGAGNHAAAFTYT